MTYSPDWLGLEAAINAKFEEGRKTLRRLAKEAIRLRVTNPQQWAAWVVGQCPYIGEGSRQIKVKPGVGALVDALDYRALLDVCIHAEHGANRVGEAMMHPDRYAVQGGSRTGYAVGVHHLTEHTHHMVDAIRHEAHMLRSATTTPTTTTTTKGASNMANTNAVPAFDFAAAGMSAIDAFAATDLVVYGAVLAGEKDAQQAAITAAAAVRSFLPDDWATAYDAWLEVASNGSAAAAAEAAMGLDHSLDDLLTNSEVVDSSSEGTRKFARHVVEHSAGLSLTKATAEDRFSGGELVEDGGPAAVASDVGPAWTAPTIDPNICRAIDSLLTAAGAGVTMEGLLNQTRSFATSAASTAERLRKMELDAQRAAMMPVTSVDASADGTRPAGTVQFKKAWELFAPEPVRKAIQVGKKAPPPALNFDFPTFDYGGAVHPDVEPIDPHYIFDPDTLVPVLWGLLTNKNVWLQGHTGAGKSTLIKQISARTGWPLARVNLDSEITRLDLVGRDTLLNEGGVTVSKFIEGILPDAMQRPAILLLDEADFGRSDVMYVIQSVLEADGLRLTEDGGRWIKPHPMFRITATGNTKGQGDEYGCYQGARVQSAALLDRFQVWVNVPYLETKTETDLIVSKAPGLQRPWAEKLVKMAGAMRKAFVSGEILTPVSPRGLETAAAFFLYLRTSFTGVNKAPTEVELMRQAVGVTIAGKASDADRQKINELTLAHIA